MALDTEQDLQDQDAEGQIDLPQPAAAAVGSLLEELAAERDNAAEQQTEDFELPNNGGLLWATYRLLPWKRVRQFSEAVQKSKSPTKELQLAAQMIAESTVEVWLRDRDGARRPWPAGETLRFEPQLLAYLRMEPLPAQAKVQDYVRVVLAPPAKSGEPRELAVTDHHRELMEWMTQANAAVSRDFAEG